jgi:predicted ferric reductase
MDNKELEYLTDNINENYKDKMSSDLKGFMNNFSSKLSILSFATCFITLFILIVLLIINSFFTTNDVFYNIIQYISITIFFTIMLSYYIVYKKTNINC